MLLEYEMDLAEGSSSFILTPGALARALSFCVYECGFFDAGDRYYTLRSGLDNHLLLYTLEGQGMVQIHEKCFSLPPGEAMLINCMSVHAYACLPGERWKFFWCHVGGSGLPVFEPLIYPGAARPIFAGPDNPMPVLFRELLKAAERSSPDFPLTSNRILTDMLTFLASQSAAEPPPGAASQHLRALDALLNHLQTHFAQPITLDEMARQLHLSKYHFARLFKQYTHMSPHEYLTNCRINAAKQLLRGSDEPLRQIGDRVGFSDVNNFIRCFRRQTGLSPTQYRKGWRNLPQGQAMKPE